MCGGNMLGMLINPQGALSDMLGGKKKEAAPAASPAAAVVSSSLSAAEMQRRSRSRSLLGAAGAVGDASGAVTASGGAVGKTAFGQ